MRDYVKRLDRLEDSGGAATIGKVIRIMWTGAEGEEPSTATCEGITLNRAANESKDGFMARVREAFPEMPGKVRCVWIDQSRPPLES